MYNLFVQGVWEILWSSSWALKVGVIGAIWSKTKFIPQISMQTNSKISKSIEQFWRWNIKLVQRMHTKKIQPNNGQSKYFIGLLSFLKRKKAGLWDHNAVCASVCPPPFNFWTNGPIFMKFSMNVMPLKHTPPSIFHFLQSTIKKGGCKKLWSDTNAT